MFDFQAPATFTMRIAARMPSNEILKTSPEDLLSLEDPISFLHFNLLLFAFTFSS